MDVLTLITLIKLLESNCDGYTNSITEEGKEIHLKNFFDITKEAFPKEDSILELIVSDFKKTIEVRRNKLENITSELIPQEQHEINSEGITSDSSPTEQPALSLQEFLNSY